jgi:hypothetical protein
VNGLRQILCGNQNISLLELAAAGLPRRVNGFC